LLGAEGKRWTESGKSLPGCTQSQSIGNIRRTHSMCPPDVAAYLGSKWRHPREASDLGSVNALKESIIELGFS